jgi:hypothetical protein
MIVKMVARCSGHLRRMTEMWADRGLGLVALTSEWPRGERGERQTKMNELREWMEWRWMHFWGEGIGHRSPKWPSRTAEQRLQKDGKRAEYGARKVYIRPENLPAKRKDPNWTDNKYCKQNCEEQHKNDRILKMSPVKWIFPLNISNPWSIPPIFGHSLCFMIKFG